MENIGLKFPTEPRKTALHKAEEWYQHLLSQKLGRPCEPVKRSNFGEYAMAVNYLTSVLEEARAIEKVAVFNIDHMAQIRFSGPAAAALLDRVLPIRIAEMNNGQCKYTLLLTEQGTVLDDMIVMRISEEEFIVVINAGHDLTSPEHNLISDADFICQYKKADEQVTVEDISARLVKIDIQGPLSYKLITGIYGREVLRNRYKP
ncbi:MAG: aminomethyl transferase family protein, partial [Candidatus Cloacimonetes bacterium]|nr:aminomethyl transferase family protein [Candidatus Cloacimonadota bacterium]